MFVDGGEGILIVLFKIFGVKIEEVEVNDFFFRKIKSRMGFFEDKVIIEMVECLGFFFLKDEERNFFYIIIYGVGEFIKYVILKGVKEIIIGIGGFVINDVGIGMLSVFGMKFLDENGYELKFIGENLIKIKKIDDLEFLKDV